MKSQFRWVSSVLFAVVCVMCLTSLCLPPISAQSGRKRSSPPVKANTQDGSSSTPRKEEVIMAGADDPALQDAEVLKIDATLITVPAVVSDSNGYYLPFLRKEQFRLFEDGTEQDISFFAPERVPFHVALILDMSGSTVLSAPDIQTAARAFVNHMRDDDKVAVVTFASSIELLCDFTDDRQVLENAIERTRSGGSTKLYEAVYKTVRNYMRNIEGRKAIILLTDGEDTSSKGVSYRDAIDAVVESDVLTYVIQYPASDWSGQTGAPGRPTWFPFPLPWPRRPQGTPPIGWPLQASFTPPQGRFPQTTQPYYSKDTFLNDLAQATGGDLYQYESMGSLSSVFTHIAEELR
ncbi:MAG TPA: VWA domain-containing protein, partial [Acidobacteriota bacterium]|nr:VWA domain-containing protein [Acidobacteriota bacterium]